MYHSGVVHVDRIELAGALQQNNYVSVAIAVAVMYDYVLTLPQEVEYVWNRSWSHVSSLFVLVRYLGCCCALVSPFYRGTTLLSSETCVPTYSYFYAGLPQHPNRCCALFTLTQFSFILFLAAADLVMILRVWAIYNRSRLIICFLFLIYIPEIVLTTVVAVIANTPENIMVITVQNRSSCVTDLSLYRCMQDAMIFLIPAGVTCVLVTVHFVRQFLQMYKSTGRWELNRYMTLLFKESILYFLVILIFGAVDVHYHSVSLEGQTWFSFLSAVSCVPVFTLTPRFILSLRALFARDIYGRGSGIDTAFGLSVDVRVTTMAFADTIRDEEAQGGEEKHIEDEEVIWTTTDDVY